MAYILKKTITNVGTTGSPSTWTWKQIVYQYWDDTNNNYLVNNVSRVVVEVYLGRPSSAQGAWYQGRPLVKTTLDGVVQDNGSRYYPYTPVAPGEWSLMFTATYDNVQHNKDGTKNIVVSSTFSSSEISPKTASVSATNTLETIPRGSKFASGTGTFVNGSNVDDGLNIKITKYVDAFYDVLTVAMHYVSSDIWFSLKQVYNIKDGDVLEFTTSELDDVYLASLPNSYVELVFYLESYTDDTYETQVGTVDVIGPINKQLNIQLPTFNNFEYNDSNNVTSVLTNDDQTIIKGYSTLNVNISSVNKAIANTRETSISHYLIDGETVLDTSSSISKSIQNYDKDNISVYAIDERNTSSLVVNKSFLVLNKFVNYTDIVKNDTQAYSRSDGGVGGFVTLIFSGSWWGDKPFGSDVNAITNSLTCVAKYRISGTSVWSAEQTLNLTLDKTDPSDTYYTLFSYNGLVNGDQPDNTFNVSESYDIMVIVSDELSNVEYMFSIHSGEPAIALYKNRASLGAKYDEILGGNQLWGNTYLNGSLLIDVDTIYPIGSIYITTNENIDPNNIFIGTEWEQIEDTFLLAAGSIYTNGDTGGEEEVVLTTQQMPSHSHWEKFISGDGNANSYVRAAGTGDKQGVYYGNQTAWVQNTGEAVYTDTTGDGEAHNNMPPYLVVCMWERIS